MLHDTLEHNFMPLLAVCFFVMAVAFNLSYFYTFGDSISFFLYVPMSLGDILKTGTVAFLYTGIFLVIFRNIFLEPLFSSNFPSVNTLLFLSVLVFISNMFYFLILDETYDSTYYLISELAFFASSLVAFFGILYFFSSGQSKNFLIGTFFASLVIISLFSGWLSAKFEIRQAPLENKSKILLTNDKVITAKILRSFDKGILVMLNKSQDINFISWNQIKEAKFKKVTGF